MDGVEAGGKTVDEAIAKALAQLGLNRDEVEVEVLTGGKQGGFLGFGGGGARVLVKPLPRNDALPGLPIMRTPRAPVASPSERAEMPPDDDELVAAAVEIVDDLLRLMQVDATVTARKPRTAGDGVGQVTAVLDIEGEDLGLLIGRRGDTLYSLQYMVNLILSRRMKARGTVGVDVEGYRRRREETLRGLAMRIAARVRQTRQSMTLEPMPPNERRIVHLTLADDPEVMTVSVGEGENRKVAITPRR